MDGFLFGLLQLVILIYSVVLHEVSHGLVARALGDRTAERMGRLTLNPLKHLDWFGSVILPFLLWVTGTGFIFGYAKPVPYDPNNLRDRKWGPAKVGLAGPSANLALAALLGGVVRFAGPALGDAGLTLLASGVFINLGLAVFNLMPVPPLDGHWLLVSALPSGAYGIRQGLYRAQWVLLALVVFVIFPTLWPLLEWLFRSLIGQSAFLRLLSGGGF